MHARTWRTLWSIFVLCFAGGNNIVVMADPNLLETVLRAEGKYPRRETFLSPNMAWLMTKLNYPVSMSFEWVVMLFLVLALTLMWCGWPTYQNNTLHPQSCMYIRMYKLRYPTVDLVKHGRRQEMLSANKSSPATCRHTLLVWMVWLDASLSTWNQYVMKTIELAMFLGH